MRTRTAALTISFLCISIASAPLPLQTTGQKPSFEVVSIKQNVSGGAGGPGTLRLAPGGRLIAEGILLRFFIQNSYGVLSNQISGGPGWIDSDRFDIEAKAEANGTHGQMGQMMQALLEDRFRLRTHRETKDLRQYDLTIAKEAFKPQSLQAVPCVEQDAPQPTAPGQNTVCGRLTTSFIKDRFQMIGGKVTTASLARMLSSQLGRMVTDKTAYSDTFDVHLEFARDDALIGIYGGPNAPGRPAVGLAPAGRSIFTALQEQLGLRLVPSKGPVEVIVIDSVEKPTAN